MKHGNGAMPEAPTTLHVEGGSDLGRLLDAAVQSDVFLEKDGVHFRLYRVEAPTLPDADPPARRLEPDRVLSIIGLGASEHGSDIANLKDQYVADAANRRE